MARAEAHHLLGKFYLDPSNRLATIHQRHREDRPDRQTGQTTDRQRSDSIERTVLQMVAQKPQIRLMLTEPFSLSMRTLQDLTVYTRQIYMPL